MSIQVSYPSKYFEASLSAKGRIDESIIPNLTPNENGVTPLDNMIAQGNEAEIKFLASKHKKALVEAIESSNALANETTNAIFKVLHDSVHRINGEYTMEAFEHSFASASGVSAIHYIARVEKEKTDEEIEQGLTGLAFYNFAKHVSWTENSLVTNEKGEFSAGNNYLLACLHFFKNHKQDYFYKNENGETIFHELATSDKNLAKMAALTLFLDIDLTKCVDNCNQTVLSTIIFNGCKKLARWYFGKYGLESINDDYSIEDDHNLSVNSACVMMSNAIKFGAHAQEYIDAIDESDLDDPSKSALNYYSSASKIDLSGMKTMSDELMKEKSKIRSDNTYITFKKIIANNKLDYANLKK